MAKKTNGNVTEIRKCLSEWSALRQEIEHVSSSVSDVFGNVPVVEVMDGLAVKITELTLKMSKLVDLVSKELRETPE